jgi:hypothetical protein
MRINASVCCHGTPPESNKINLQAFTPAGIIAFIAMMREAPTITASGRSGIERSGPQEKVTLDAEYVFRTF